MVPFQSSHEQSVSRMTDIKKPPSFEDDTSWRIEPLEEIFLEKPLKKSDVWYVPATREKEMYTASTDETSPVETIVPVWKRKKKNSFRKAVAIVIVFLLTIFVVVVVLKKGREIKESVLYQSEAGYTNLSSAVDNLKAQEYVRSLAHFKNAETSFEEASKNLTLWGEALVDLTQFVPGLSKMASGKHVIEAGKYFASAGAPLTFIAHGATESKEAYMQGEKISLLDFLFRIRDPLHQVALDLRKAQEELVQVKLEDIPEEKREKFLSVRTRLPVLLGVIDSFEKHETLLVELLGGNGPRKYLFLLQNNHELRATGGFIGSYALLDVNNGVVRRFFVDGIFNPDGQLRENIIPPKAIQKISAGWSLHDSNWFPDFPTSAEKAIFFYEKTGGPTVDGVITLTPTVMQKLLLVTGPIALPQYGLTVDADNFIPVVQEQVEVNYDKEENKPKKILADLSVLLLEKVFASQDKETLYRVADALVQGLSEKHVLLYMRYPETEELIDEAGWSGRVLATSKDYLSVIHTNINGYKTDGVIDEEIKHMVAIQKDGSIIDTVTITRTHLGGETPYDWWNRVNADYLRVYVPKGSKLLSAKGATWEFPPAPLDYEKLGFKSDADVAREEKNTQIDEKSGTRIYDEAGKTVFGAWVYVSPQESVTVEYQYQLPFRIKAGDIMSKGVDSFSVLYQKQSGSIGSALTSSITFPENWQVIWQTETNLIPYEREHTVKTTLKTDVFKGIVFGSK